MRYGPVNRKQSVLLLSLLGGTASLATSQTHAQDPADTIALDTISVAGVSPQAETAYGPVVGYRATRSATATRTDTPLRDLPQTVNVVPREVLVDRQETRLADALFNVSNVQPAGTIQGRSDTFVIRGFRTQTYAIDGVLLSQANNFNVTQRDLADVERIEVLKGPATVLYGRGDPGGLINIVTRHRPSRRAPRPASRAAASGSGASRVRCRARCQEPRTSPGGSASRPRPTPPFRNFGDRDKFPLLRRAGLHLEAGSRHPGDLHRRVHPGRTASTTRV